MVDWSFDNISPLSAIEKTVPYLTEVRSWLFPSNREDLRLVIVGGDDSSSNMHRSFDPFQNVKSKPCRDGGALEKYKKGRILPHMSHRYSQ